MGWFSKKKNDDYLDIIEEELNEEESFYVPFGQPNDGKVQPSHVLTAQEVKHTQDDSIPMENGQAVLSPLEVLKSRVMQQAAEKQAQQEEQLRIQEEKQRAAKAEAERKAAEEAKRIEEERIAAQRQAELQAMKAAEAAAEKAAEEAARAAAQERLEKVMEAAPAVKPQEEVSPATVKAPDSVPDLNFDDIGTAPTTKEEEIPAEPAPRRTNLLEKCTPFIIDDEGNSAAEEKPAYTLESVESILGIPEKEKEEPAEEKTVFHSEGITLDKTEKNHENPIINSETIVMERSAFMSHGVVSDIDSEGAEKHTNPAELSATAAFTKRFDPIAGKAGINTATFTRVHDLTSGIADATEKQEAEERMLEDIFGSDAEEEFEPKDEYLCYSDAKRIGKGLKISKRNSFYGTAVSFVCLVLAGIFSLPAIVTAFSGAPMVHAIIQCCFAGIAFLSNLSVFKSIITLFKKHTSPDVAVLFAVILGAVCIALDFEAITNLCYICLLMCFILFCRSACVFSRASYMLSNFRFIASTKKKNAVTLIDDRPTTLSMAGGSIDGDVLVAATRRVTNVTDFMKNAEAPTQFEGRFKIIFIFFLIAAVLCGFAGGMTGSSANALYCAFSVMALLCAPTLIMCDIMPLKYAAKKLNRRGAMISGKPALNKLEMANACVMRSSDFFPKGTVTLHNLQVLSDNSIDRTLLEAAAVTAALKSPLADILCDIACNGDASALPQCDSVKYENKMGISGWVGNNRLFIGNYDLLEAHGITPPDFEVVKKILRNGYFPVFVACNQKACAMLSVKYNVNYSVAKELAHICNAGITLLVNNCDANLSEEMLCDYFGLYPDSIHIMNDAGIHMLKNRINYVESCAAPAVHTEQPAVLPTILHTAIKAKRAIAVLRVLHIVFAVLGVLAITFLSFNRSDVTVNGLYILIYEAAVSLIAWIIGLISR